MKSYYRFFAKIFSAKGLYDVNLQGFYTRHMLLKKINIVGYRNISQAELEFSPNVNCLVGANGMGKTNVLDAIYYLSFCKSSANPIDSQNITHGHDFFMIDGNYESHDGVKANVVCSVQRGQPKRLSKNGKRMARISDHVGSIPLVMISPRDGDLVAGMSEERRRFLDSAISQYDKIYLSSLIRYEAALKQRNAMMRQEDVEPDWELVSVFEEQMSAEADIIFSAREAFTREFVPIFKQLYAMLCDNAAEATEVGIEYDSHLHRGPLKSQLEAFRAKERIVGYTLHGVHKDELQLTLGGYPVRREGSQGQTKTYFIAMKLAQFLFLKEKGERRTPLLLLDDVFDKLDAGRVGRIVDYVSGDAFGQIFITDTGQSRLNRILHATKRDYRLFLVENGKVEQAGILNE